MMKCLKCGLVSFLTVCGGGDGIVMDSQAVVPATRVAWIPMVTGLVG